MTVALTLLRSSEIQKCTEGISSPSGSAKLTKYTRKRVCVNPGISLGLCLRLAYRCPSSDFEPVGKIEDYYHLSTDSLYAVATQDDAPK